MFWTVHLIGWLSLRCLVVFLLELWIVLSFGPFFFFLSWRICYLKGRSLRCSPGRGNAGHCAVMLYVGEGPRGSNGARSPLHRISVFLSLCYPQSNWALLVLVPEWVGLCTPQAPVGASNDLSHEAGSLSCCCPNPHGRFQSEVWGFISPRWSPGLRVCFAPLHLSGLSVRECGIAGCYPLLCLPLSPPLWVRPSQFMCANVGPRGLLVVRLPALLVPHSASLRPATATRVLSALVPISAPPTGLDECLFFISLVSDFLAVRFSVSSGCARRRSMSTYATILVLLLSTFLKEDVIELSFGRLI